MIFREDIEHPARDGVWVNAEYVDAAESRVGKLVKALQDADAHIGYSPDDPTLREIRQTIHAALREETP